MAGSASPLRTRFDNFRRWFFRGGLLPGWALLVLPIIFATFLIVLVLLIGWPLVFAQFWHFVETHNRSYWFLVCGVFFVTCFGCMMYVLRERVRIVYGLMELSGAIALTWITLAERHPSGVVFATALMGAVYIFVRGIDDVRQYTRDKEMQKKWLTSTLSHADALDKGISKLLREENIDNAAAYRNIHSETQSFVVVAQEILVRDGREREYRICVDQKVELTLKRS